MLAVEFEQFLAVLRRRHADRTLERSIESLQVVVAEHLGKRLQRRIVIDVGKTPHGLVDAVAVDVTAESLPGLLVDRTGDIGCLLYTSDAADE